MFKEFDLRESLRFPNQLYEKKIDEYYIIVAPEYPNWIVLSENEYRMYSILKEGHSLRFTLEQYYVNYCQNEEECLRVMTNLLVQIDDVGFYFDAEVKYEDPIETITKKIHVNTTNGCNMRCRHCFMAAGTEPLKTIDLDETIKIIEYLNHKYGKLEIVVSGGEPLTYVHLDSFLKAIKDNYIILFTNGSLITEKNIDYIVECCDEVQVSFEGISKQYYEAIRGTNNYDKVLHSLRLLIDENVRVVLAITILPDTLSDIQKNLISFVNNLNYKNLEVRLNDEIEMSGNALTMDMSHYSKKETTDTIIKIMRELQTHGFTVQKKDIRNTRFTNCGIGANLVINYDGNIYPCNKFSEYAFEMGSNPEMIIKEFDDVNRRTSVKYINKCSNCELQYICAGGCRVENLIETGCMNIPICSQSYKEEKYRNLLNDYKMYRENVN